jgi:hypothetical protein
LSPPLHSPDPPDLPEPLAAPPPFSAASPAAADSSPEYADRFRRLWERTEALVTVYLEAFWSPPPALLPPPAPASSLLPPLAPPPAESDTPPSPRRRSVSRSSRSSRSSSSTAAADAGTESPLTPPDPVAAFDALYPPGIERPRRPAPPPRDLSAAIICLRRIQDARLALDRGLSGGPHDEDDGTGIDDATLKAGISHVLMAASGRDTPNPDEETMRD